jgi:hypothetical protein
MRDGVDETGAWDSISRSAESRRPTVGGRRKKAPRKKQRTKTGVVDRSRKSRSRSGGRVRRRRTRFVREPCRMPVGSSRLPGKTPQDQNGSGSPDPTRRNESFAFAEDSPLQRIGRSRFRRVPDPVERGSFASSAVKIHAPCRRRFEGHPKPPSTPALNRGFPDTWRESRAPGAGASSRFRADHSASSARRSCGAAQRVRGWSRRNRAAVQPFSTHAARVPFLAGD